jgi:hypothetical protein
VYVCQACESTFGAALAEEREARRRADLERGRARQAASLVVFPRTLGGILTEGSGAIVAREQIPGILAEVLREHILESVDAHDRLRMLSLVVGQYRGCLHYWGESSWTTRGHRSLAIAIEEFLVAARRVPGVTDELVQVARHVWELARSADPWAEDLASRKDSSTRRDVVVFLCDVISGKETEARPSSESFYRRRNVDDALAGYYLSLLKTTTDA